MKYYKTQNKYKASNVVLDMNTLTAWSYDWWAFLKNINGRLVFNDYRYSPSTQKHQAKVRSLLNQLGLTVVTIKCPKGLQSGSYKESAIEFYKGRMPSLARP